MNRTPLFRKGNRVRRLAKRHPEQGDGSDGGFTLVELMVVLLVIAILIAVVIPTYRGARERAQDRVAQLNLRTALIAARVVHSDLGGYGPIEDFGDPGDALFSVEPTLEFSEDASLGPLEVSLQVAVSDGVGLRRNVVKLSLLSDNDVCWFIWDDDEVGTFYGQADLDGLDDHAKRRDACRADQADTRSRSFGNQVNAISLKQSYPVGQRFARVCFYREGWQPAYRPAKRHYGSYTCPEPLTP